MSDERVEFVQGLLTDGVTDPSEIHRQLISHGFSGAGHLELIAAAQGSETVPTATPASAVESSIPDPNTNTPPVTESNNISVAPVPNDIPATATARTAAPLSTVRTDAVTGKTLLIGYGVLFSKVFSESFRYWKLIGGFVLTCLLILGVLMIAIVGSGALIFIDPILAVSVFMLLYLAVLVLGAVAALGYIRALLYRYEGGGYWHHFWWSIQHFWTVGLMLLGVQLIVTGGFLLLVIPGIVLSMYIGFAFHNYADEQQGVLNTFLRSTHMVSGRWWSVFGRAMMLAFTVMLLLLVPFILLPLVISATEGLIVLVPLLIMFVAAVIALNVMGYGVVLVYESLRDSAPVSSFDPQTYRLTKYIYYGFMVLGVVVVGFQLFGMFQSFQQTGQFFEATQTGDFSNLIDESAAPTGFGQQFQTLE